MKSEFILAFNEICEERGLPKEEVFEALKTALVSAYRRNVGVSNNQDVVADIDQRTGEPTVFAEKEVVDSIFDPRTEVLIAEARQSGHPDAQLGDTVLVDSTPANFGRIAAQTAKQVLLQRVREAERDQLFDEYSQREGEIVNGTVQSISGGNITIGLGRTEAILPRSQQVPGERYRPHDKIRIYVLEVRKTSRGPQIVVSRNHRSLLRRLLELEVPEIYNGQVDIKSIAREAGARSKVAVVALQPGVDPVGACVGMRGVRIQSIVRELNDEKIDVIEWDPDQRTFIAKALSPARVSQVFLEDHPINGKTAVVVVPDDQLSLAIGREGQNARLAAKLTGWRIDIKSLAEAASESLQRLGDPHADPAIVRNKELIEQVQQILEKKAAGRPVTAEDYSTMNRLVAGVEGRIIAARAAKHEEIRRQRAAARRTVHAEAWEVPLDVLQLSNGVYDILVENNIKTLGDLLFQLELGEDTLLGFDGFDPEAVQEVHEALEAYEREKAEADAARKEAEALAAQAEDAETPESAEEALPEMIEHLDEAVAEAEEALPEERVDEITSETIEEPIPGVLEEPTRATALDEEAEEEELPVEDLERPLVSVAEKKKAEKSGVKLARPLSPGRREESSELDKDEDEDAARRRKSRQLVYDEDAGRVVAKRKRKKSRRRPEWEELVDAEEFDLDELDEKF